MGAGMKQFIENVLAAAGFVLLGCVAFIAGVLARQEEQIVLLFAPFRRFLLTAWAVGWGKQKNGSELFCSERH